MNGVQQIDTKEQIKDFTFPMFSICFKDISNERSRNTAFYWKQPDYYCVGRNS